MRRSREQGAVLGLVIVTAAVFMVAAFAALTMALSRAQVANTIGVDRLRATYSAEAGIVWAMQRLWANPAWSSGAGVDLTVPSDLDGNGVIAAGEGLAVDVLYTPCGVPPCTLQARVVY